MSYNQLGLERVINKELDKIAKPYNIILEEETSGDRFEELIIKLSEKRPVAIIIDEYDKPIIDYLDELDRAEENRKILKDFYSVLKDLDKQIRFFFITGVSKFSKIFIFSDLNNLVDITIDENYSQIVGWTKEEVEKNFPDYINEIAERYKDIFPDIMLEMKKWYNGYSWDGITKVYNPVSLMNFFQKRVFGSYWFATGTPTMLMDIIKTRQITAFNIEKLYISTDILDKYDFNNLNFKSLLFQTGYLTIKNYDTAYGELTLGYPNKEVAKSFSIHILSAVTLDRLDDTDSLLHRIRRSFLSNEIEKFIDYINILLKNISYTIVDKNKENYYHSIFFLIMKLLGFNIEVEIKTIDGRIDAVIHTKDNIFILEFKIDQSAEKAIQQIKDKKYALKYKDDKKPIFLIGINFDTNKKYINDYKNIPYNY